MKGTRRKHDQEKVSVHSSEVISGKACTLRINIYSIYRVHFFLLMVDNYGYLHTYRTFCLLVTQNIIFLNSFVLTGVLNFTAMYYENSVK